MRMPTVQGHGERHLSRLHSTDCAGAVAAAGFITLLKTMPTIVASFLEAFRSLGRRELATCVRTERDFSILVVVLGSLGLIGLMAVLPAIRR